jgi:hypothetical protein
MRTRVRKRKGEVPALNTDVAQQPEQKQVERRREQRGENTCR